MYIIGKPKLIRQINSSLLLKNIRDKKVFTKSELYVSSNLSRQTINNIVITLIKKDLVEEIGYGSSTLEGGKKPTLYKFNADAHYLVGAMMGLNRIRCGITNLEGKLIVEKFITTIKDSGPEDIINRLITLIRSTIKDSEIDKNKLFGIGIGVPGIVNFKEGIVETLPLFKDWKDVSMKDVITKEFNLPVVIDNENRMRAVGEKWFGLAKNKDNFITIITGDGIGGGVVINGEIIRGKNLICGEIGHMKISTTGPKCACGGIGCFETLINNKSINEFISEIIIKNTFNNSKMLNLFREKGKVSFEELFDFYNNDDILAAKIIDKIIYWFGRGISNLICLYDPEMIIIHGEYLKLKDLFFRELEDVVSKNIFPHIKKKIVIKKSIIGHDIGIVGSASMVLDIINL